MAELTEDTSKMCSCAIVGICTDSIGNLLELGFIEHKVNIPIMAIYTLTKDGREKLNAMIEGMKE